MLDTGAMAGDHPANGGSENLGGRPSARQRSRREAMKPSIANPANIRA